MYFIEIKMLREQPGYSFCVHKRRYRWMSAREWFTTFKNSIWNLEDFEFDQNHPKTVWRKMDSKKVVRTLPLSIWPHTEHHATTRTDLCTELSSVVQSGACMSASTAVWNGWPSGGKPRPRVQLNYLKKFGGTLCAWFTANYSLRSMFFISYI